MSENTPDPPEQFNLSCPRPLVEHQAIQMAHGGGGRLMQRLLEELFLPAFGAEGDSTRVPPHDAAILSADDTRLAFTTDSYVVHPLFFPGGDIGRMAVFGTVNDLAMAGAEPLGLSAAFILEEGLPMETLRRVVQSMRQAADEAGVAVITGDTKVVDRGKGDGLYVNTAGIGRVLPGVEIGPQRVRPGDAVLVSGDLGRHGMAIMSVREGLEFESPIESDCATLWPLVAKLIDAGGEIHCLRDLTRGGLAAALNEIARCAGVGIELLEETVPVSEPVAAACELLGLDPLYVANEGRMVAFVPPEAAESTLEIMRSAPNGEQAVVVGVCTLEHPGTVEVRTSLGTGRVLDLLSGEQMPRIC